MIGTIDQLNEKTAACTKCLDEKITGSDGKRHIVLCGGTGCLSSHSDKIKEKFDEVLAAKGLADKATVNIVGCFGFCSQGPFVKIYPEDTLYRMVKIEDVEEIVDVDIAGGQVVERLLYVDPATKEKVSKQDEINFYKKQRRIALHGCGVINPEDINEALGMGAFEGLKKALSMTQQEVIDEVLKSGLRGRGGGGFPTGRKWQFAYNVKADQKYVVCNGDEGDPGAFMDRSILEGNPLAVIEGMMIAGYAFGASEGYFYVRAEYPLAIVRLEKAIKDATERGFLGDNILGSDFSCTLRIKAGAGAFVCGEETALIESLEGKRGMPRLKPPFPAQSGYWQKPSNINNVETYANVPWIINNGGAAFAAMGTEQSKGTKVFALSGKIKRGGLVEIPMGTTLRDVIFDIGGGIKNDVPFKAVQLGGPSGGCVPAEKLDTIIDYAELGATGAIMGSGGMVVMDETTCMVNMAKFFLDFTAKESCGKCIHCRLGTKRMLEILDRIVKGQGEEGDIEKLEELCYAIKDGALCGLGQTAPNPVLTTIRYFRDEFEAHIEGHHCPAGECRDLITYSINKDKCVGCSACSRQCPANAITGVVKSPFEIDPDLCVKCGNCKTACKFGAVEVH